MKTNAPYSIKMPKLIISMMFLFFLVIGFTSCLSVEKKEYIFEFTGVNSGKLTIRYINIYSNMDDGKDVSADDFKDVLDKYINGSQIEEDYPGAKNITKRLYEENGQLHGEVTMEFSDLNSARLYQYDRSGPIMMNISTAYDSEAYLSSNGEYGNDHMPVVFWPAQTKKLQVTTSVSKPEETSVSLVNAYREWKSRK